MLIKLRIRNFQCHKKLDLEFKDGVNTVVGETDIGKSAAIRAYGWVTSNRPAGDDFIRHGAKSASVSLTFSDGTKVKRTKGKLGNHYYLNGKKFTAFGSDVPTPIVNALKLSSVNLQRQLDAPFWFDLSPGQVSKNLNKIADLSVIDEVLHSISQELRKRKSEHVFLTEERDKDKEQIANYRWAVRANKDLKSIISLNSSLEKLSHQATTLDEVLQSASEFVTNIKEMETRLVGATDIRAALDSITKATETEKELENILEEIAKCSELGSSIDLSILNADYRKIQDRLHTLVGLSKTEKDLENIVSDFSLSMDAEMSSRTAKDEAESQFLSETKNESCPLCKQKINHIH